MMQAPALVETASSEVYHSNEGNLQRDTSKKCFIGCSEVKSTYPDDEWDSSAIEQRANDIDKIHLSEPRFSEILDTNMENTYSQSSVFEDSVGCFLNETYSICNYSESELKNGNVINLNSELEPEVEKQEEMFYDILEHQSIDIESIYKISDVGYKETATDMEKCDIGEDSQQEYHSADEQEYVSNHVSFEQSKALSVSNLKVVEFRNSDNKVKCVSSLEDNYKQLESSSVASSDSLNVFASEYSPLVFKFHNSGMLKEYYEPEYETSTEQETNLICHTVFDDVAQRSTFLGNEESQPMNDFLSPQKVLKPKMHTEKMKSQISENKDFCENTNVENKFLQGLENPSTLPQDTALEPLCQSCEDYQTSWISVFDDSIISACGYSQYKSLQSTPHSAACFSPTLPRTVVRNNQAVNEDRPLKVINNNTTNKTCSHDVKRSSKSVTDKADCIVTINQTVDVSSDFRSCFTTSRATSAKPSVISTSSNTEITMMNKKRPSKCQSEKQRSVACNTDWSYGQDCVDIPVTVPQGPGVALSVDGLKPDGNFLSKDSLKLRKTFDNTDLEKHPERKFKLPEELEKNFPSECCKKVMQRAVKAEIHLLNIHYQMCHRHCCDIYKLVMESKGLNRNLPNYSAKKELESALLSILEDLKVRFINLKEKIHKGIPLEELPPLSVASKFLTNFSTFASRIMKEESQDFAGTDCELDNQTASEVEVSPGLKKTLSQISLLSDISHLKQDTSPKKDDFKNDDTNADFSQLEVDDKAYRNCHEISDDWFDAKENLTGTDFSEIQKNQIGGDQWNPKFIQEMKTIEPLPKDKSFLIHVGGLCPSVSEADLRFYFQKYQVSEISIYDSSNYRYASLTFKKISDANMAVKEMNGIEINGKSVNVRLVKIRGEHTSSLSSKNENRVSLNNLEKNTKREVNSDSSTSRLPRTRPGQEQDNEFSPLTQKDVKKNCKQIESTQPLPKIPVQFMPPNTLNLRSFTKIMKRLSELYPEVSRDHIINALQEVRLNHKGFLNGLSISTIVEKTSSVLKNSASS
ncbi:RNA-binding protein 44 [Ctenodactylus gundi]